MPYSDEPKIVSEGRITRRHIVTGAVAALLVLLVGGSLAWQWNHNRVRDHMPRGDHGGFSHAIPESGYEAEILRAPTTEDHAKETVYIWVSRAGHSHDHIAGLTVEVRGDGGDWVPLPWSGDIEFYGPAENLALPYKRDRRVDVRILENGREIWNERIWAYSPHLARSGMGGHSHSH